MSNAALISSHSDAVNLAPLLSLSLLTSLLVAAVVSDVRKRRIPNALVLAGSMAGLALHYFMPAGQGLFRDGGLGVPAALLGGLTGLALFLPAYALRMMGAGDVKLLAMLGVWLGARPVVDAAVWSLLAGGVLAIVFSLYARSQHKTNGLTAASTQTLGLRPTSSAAGASLPYAVAIAMGSAITVSQIVWAG